MSTTNDSASLLDEGEQALTAIAKAQIDAIVGSIKALKLPEEIESRVQTTLLNRMAELMAIPRDPETEEEEKEEMALRVLAEQIAQQIRDSIPGATAKTSKWDDMLPIWVNTPTLDAVDRHAALWFVHGFLQLCVYENGEFVGGIQFCSWAYDLDGDNEFDDMPKMLAEAATWEP